MLIFVIVNAFEEMLMIVENWLSTTNDHFLSSVFALAVCHAAITDRYGWILRTPGDVLHRVVLVAYVHFAP